MFGSWQRREGGSGRNVLADGTEVDLVLYKFDSCPYCVRVHRTIDELGVHVEYRDTRSVPRWRQDLLAKTGIAQVPCLFVDGEPMFESLDIVAWLRATFSPARQR